MQRLTEIKSRIKSVSDTRKITGAMETISVAKARKATDAAEANAPLFEKIGRLTADALRSSAHDESCYTAAPSKDSITLYVVIASNKGLAGGYNSNVLKRAYSKIVKNQNHLIFTVGYEAEDFFANRQMKVRLDFSERAAVPGMELADEIAREARQLFDNLTVGRVVIFYTNLLKNRTAEIVEAQLLPVVLEKTKASEPEFDPSPGEVLTALIPAYLTWSIYGALLQSAAAEHHARRIAMNSAGRNAGELLEELTREFNSARQSSVTTELNEIVATGMGVRK